jgi:thiosulfate reductase cytochrome b subunit
MARADIPFASGHVLVYRHPFMVRVTHWVNAVCLLVLLGSGLQIFNAHPALYWGETSDFDAPFLAIGATTDPQAGPRGYLDLAGLRIDTTGLLGVAWDDGRSVARAFPAWATLPGFHDLGAGRRWHFFFAWIFAGTLALMLMFNVASGRMRRDLLPGGTQMRGLGRSFLDHLRLRIDHGARGYNVLQKLAYLGIMLIVLPLMVATGLAMSPTVNAIAPWLSEILGGRQSARTLHFLTAGVLVLFFLVHIAMVMVAGPLNEMRSILTGWFKVRPLPAGKDAP